MADFFATLGGRVTIGMLNETLGNLDEEERTMLAGWGLAPTQMQVGTSSCQGAHTFPD